MRKFCAALVAASLLATSAFAADLPPLAPGKPAGVKQAELGGDLLLYVIGAAAIIAGICIIASGNGNGTVTPGTPPKTSTQ
jgi:hypothetical protein